MPKQKEHILSKDCWCNPKVISYKKTVGWSVEWADGKPDIGCMRDNGYYWQVFTIFPSRKEAIAYRDEKHLAKSAKVIKVSICPIHGHQ